MAQAIEVGRRGGGDGPRPHGRRAVPRLGRLGRRSRGSSRICSAIPLVGNGDLKTPEAVVAAFDRYGVDGVMIGRAALGPAVAVPPGGGRAARRADPARADAARTAAIALGPFPAGRRAIRPRKGHDPDARLRLLLRPGPEGPGRFAARSPKPPRRKSFVAVVMREFPVQ